MNIALILCPWYSGGTSPSLGLGYINGCLISRGHTTFPYDLEFLFAKDNPRLLASTNALFGVPAHGTQDVMFIVRPELHIYALFPEAYKDASTIPVTKTEADLVAQIRKQIELYANLILDQHMDLIMFSAYVSNLTVSLMMAQYIKKHSSKRIFFGGPGIGLPEIYEYVMKLGFVDGCVIGEGEQTIIDIVDVFDGDIPAIGVPGFVVKNGAKEFVPRPLIEDLDSLPYPNFSNFPTRGHNLRAYLISGKDISIPVSTCRGCIMNCAFCSESKYWHRFRQRTVESVVDEIRAQIDRHKIRRIRFNDSLTNADKGWLDRFCEIVIKERIDVRWAFSYLRPSALDRTLATKMRTAGCEYVSLGLETGSQKVRQRLKKGTDDEEVMDVLESLESAGIKTQVNILSGFPNESWEEYYENIAFIDRWFSRTHNAESVVFWLPAGLLRIEPYSDLYIHPDKYGILIAEKETLLPRQLSPLKEDLDRMAYSWHDASTYREKMLKAFILSTYLGYIQPKLGRQARFSMIRAESLLDSTLLEISNRNRYEILRRGEDDYIVVYQNNLLIELDQMGYQILSFLEAQPRSIKDLCSLMKTPPIAESFRTEVVGRLVELINAYPFPLVKILESLDMNTDLTSNDATSPEYAAPPAALYKRES